MALMTRKRVLLMGKEGVVLFTPAGRGVRREAVLSKELPDFEKHLADLLTEKSSSRSLILLSDGEGQTYKIFKQMPKLSFIDRPQYIKRMLEMTWPSNPVRAAIDVKPKPPETKSAPLFVTMGEGEVSLINRVSLSVDESGASIAGCGMLSAESTGLAVMLSEKIYGPPTGQHRWVVLISQSECGSSRQVVVRNGIPVMTRSPSNGAGGTSGAGWAEDMIQEFRATLTYLSRKGYSAEEDILEVFIICGDVEKQFFDRESVGVEKFTCLNLREALAHIGADTPDTPKTNYADALHAAWVSKRGRLWLPIAVPNIQRVMRPRQMVRFASVALAITAALLVSASVTAYSGHGALQSELLEKQNQKTMLEREYVQESVVFNDLPIRPETAMAIRDVKKMLDENSAFLAPFLTRMQTALPPNIKVHEMEYGHTPNTVLPIKVENSGASKNLLGQGSPRGLLNARISFSFPDVEVLEEKVKNAEMLVAALRAAFPGYTVTIERQFQNVQSDGTFAGETADDQEERAVRDGTAVIAMEGAPF